MKKISVIPLLLITGICVFVFKSILPIAFFICVLYLLFMKDIVRKCQKNHIATKWRLLAHNRSVVNDEAIYACLAEILLTFTVVSVAYIIYELIMFII